LGSINAGTDQKASTIVFKTIQTNRALNYKKNTDSY